MRYFDANRRELFHGVPFELDGFAFPGNFLALSSPEEIAARGITVEPDPVPVIDIDELKASLKSSVKAAARDARAKYTTVDKDRIYDRKAAEALQAMADPAPTKSAYPLLAASIGIEVSDTGNEVNDLKAVADLIRSRILPTAQLDGVVERLELAACKAIREASTVEAAQAAAQVVWP